MKYYYLIVLAFFMLFACKKDLLERKPNSSLTIPSTVDDFQQLLDNIYELNTTPALGELSADDYYVLDYPSWQSIPDPIARNAYIWERDLFEGATRIDDWGNPFNGIFSMNVILNKLDSDSTEYQKDIYDNVRAQALFNRGWHYWNLSQVFCMPLDSASMNSQLGLPVRTSSNVDEVVPRSSLKATYDFILSDLHRSLQYFREDHIATNKNRASKVAAFSTLSRVYLVLGNYVLSERFADSAISNYGKLIDFNSLSTTAANPFNIYNDELVLRHNTAGYTTINTTSTIAIVDSVLFKSYHADDLRKKIYFRAIPGTSVFGFKRGLAGSGAGGFGGIASSEVIFNKAECMARRGADSLSVELVNTVLRKRFRKDTFIPYHKDSIGNVLNFVLLERRKDLVWRGIRWLDIRRLNRQGANIIITRRLNNQTYSLTPNDRRYALPLPDAEIFGGGLTQNER